MPKSRTAKFYAKNPKALAKKRAYNREYAAKPEAIAKRAELVKKNRELQKQGKTRKGDGLDTAHKPGGKFKSEKPSVNRGDGKTMPGDRAARGKGAKKNK